MITKRQRELVRLLKNSSVSLTANSLSKTLRVSIKTVRNDIATINKIVQQELITSKAGTGYSLQDSQSGLMKLEADFETDNLHFGLLQKILKVERINFYDLADSFYISESTLTRSIKEINQVMSEKDSSLCIIRKNNHLLIDANEEKKRKLFNVFINREIQTHKVNLGEYADYFDHCDLKLLTTFVIRHHKMLDFYMNDFSTISFIIHIAVLIERINNSSYIEVVQTNKLDKESQKLAQQFINEIKNSLGIEIPERELYYVANLYAGKFVIADRLEEKKFMALIERLLKTIYEQFSIDFSADELMKDYLSNHLSALYSRARQKKYLNNPLTNELKNKYPFIYNLSVVAADFIQKELRIDFPDDEIAYIVLHFLSASETMSMGKKKKILLVSPYGAASRRVVSNRLRKLDFMIELIEVPTIFEIQNYLNEELNLIITTEAIESKTAVPVYQYSAIFDEVDVQQVEKILNEQREPNELVTQFFKEELFFPKQKFENREQIIKFLCEQLTKWGYCDSIYVEKVLSREHLSSTSYGNFYAIPHAIQRNASKNGIAVCSLDKPILWGGNRVSLVLLLALKKERDNSYEELFGFLGEVLSEGTFVKKLSKQTNFHAFIELCK